MNKTVLTVIIVIVLVAAAGVAGYALGSNNAERASNSNNNESSTSATANEDKDEGLNLEAILSNLESEYPTIEETYIYTEDRDPNDNLGKAGFYVAGAQFYDTRTETAPSTDDPAFGTDSGGAIEVYANNDDAKNRIELLSQFQGDGFLDPGAFEQVDNVVIRVSTNYKASEQKEVLDFLVSQVKG